MLFYFILNLVLINLIFFLGLFCIFFSFRSNFFLIIAVETMFLSINLNFLFFSIYLDSIKGIIFVLFIMVVSAIEIVVFLSYFVIFYKKITLLDSFDNFNYLKQ